MMKYNDLKYKFNHNIFHCLLFKIIARNTIKVLLLPITKAKLFNELPNLPN